MTLCSMTPAGQRFLTTLSEMVKGHLRSLTKAAPTQDALRTVLALNPHELMQCISLAPRRSTPGRPSTAIDLIHEALNRFTIPEQQEIMKSLAPVVIPDPAASDEALIAGAEKYLEPMVGEAWKDEKYRSELAEAIRANPEDPAPWLVYADWLMMQGNQEDQIRSELIILEDRIPQAEGEARKTMRERQAALQNELAASWTKKVFPMMGRITFSWRNGYLDRVMGINDDGFLERLFQHEESRFLRTVGIGSLNMRWHTDMRRLEDRLDLPQLATMTDLTVYWRSTRAMEEELIRILRQSLSRILGIRRFTLDTDLAPHRALADFGLSAGMVETLVGLPFMRRLKAFGLRRAHIGVAGAETIAQSQNLSGLEELDLQQNWIGNEGVRALVRAPTFRQTLRILNLSESAMGDEGVRTLISYFNLPTLKVLDLSRNPYIIPDAIQMVQEWARERGIEVKF